MLLAKVGHHHRLLQLPQHTHACMGACTAVQAVQVALLCCFGKPRQPLSGRPRLTLNAHQLLIQHNLFCLQAWYFLSTAGSAFVLPYFNVYFDALGFSKEQIGTLSALRPWLSAPCAVALCSLADKLSCHTSLLVLTFTASLFLRCLLLLAPARFIAVAALVLLSDCIGAPVGAIVDATVVGACKSDGEDGRP